MCMLLISAWRKPFFKTVAETAEDASGSTVVGGIRKIFAVILPLLPAYHPLVQDVLIVDDEPDSREAMSGYLSKSGHHVRSAPNGQEAIAQLTLRVPDVIILDWMMPKMDGITFLEIVRSYLNWSNIPIALVTAHRGPHIEKARTLGVDSVFIKGSFDLSSLNTFVVSAGRPGADHRGFA